MIHPELLKALNANRKQSSFSLHDAALLSVIFAISMCCQLNITSIIP